MSQATDTADFRAGIEPDLCAQRDSGSDSRPSVSSLIDAPALLATCGGDRTLLQTMIRSFQTHIRRHLLAVEMSVGNRSALHLRESSHKLRGLLLAFSSAAADVAGMLEQMAAVGDLDRAEESHARVSNMINTLSHSLSDLTIDDLKRQAGLPAADC
jgi:hypothetical protein